MRDIKKNYVACKVALKTFLEGFMDKQRVVILGK